MRFGVDLPIRDIAVRWQLEPDAVHRAYARAREEFRLVYQPIVDLAPDFAENANPGYYKNASAETPRPEPRLFEVVSDDAYKQLEKDKKLIPGPKPLPALADQISDYL